MIYLLDVNVLIALLDADHLFHDRAEDWFEHHAEAGWATSPHTQNGLLRILGSARYPSGPASPAGAASILRGLLDYRGHHFWPDDLSLVSDPAVDLGQLGTAAHVTDTYLLALAVRRGGKLATFDRRLSAQAVHDGRDALELIA